MKRIIVALLLIFILSACHQGNVHKVNWDEAKEMMETTEDYVLVDVRSPQEYEEGHIPNAINIDNAQIQKAESVLEQLPDTDQSIFLYCRSGNRSNQSAIKLQELGYTDITDFGGIQDWDGDIETD